MSAPLPVLGEIWIGRLTNEQERSAFFSERLNEIWPYMVRRVNRMLELQDDRDRSNCAATDILQELAAELRKKDHLWRPERGRYITFATFVLRGILSRYPRMARTVTPPCNTRSRYRKAMAAAEKGNRSGVQVAGAILNVMKSTRSITGEQALADHRHRSSEAVRDLLLDLPSNLHVQVITLAYGLAGDCPMSCRAIACTLGIELDQAIRLKAEGVRIMRKFLGVV